jgi:hypothetical protein
MSIADKAARKKAAKKVQGEVYDKTTIPAAIVNAAGTTRYGADE